MPRVYARSGALVYVRRFRKPARLLGMLYLAVGLSLCVGLWLAPSGAMRSSVRGVALAAGLVCTFVGAGLFLGRAGRTIDHEMGTASRWWGLGVPLVRQSRSLEEIAAVAAVGDDCAGYSVCLLDAAGTPWEFLATRELEAARHVAAEAAAFLGRPWYDLTQVQQDCPPHETSSEPAGASPVPPEPYQ